MALVGLIDDYLKVKESRNLGLKAGQKFAFGFHYLRPHETFHEPSRKFFDNEVFRVPLYEVLPLDTIWKQCWVMDPSTFCR